MRLTVLHKPMRRYLLLLVCAGIIGAAIAYVSIPFATKRPASSETSKEVTDTIRQYWESCRQALSDRAAWGSCWQKVLPGVIKRYGLNQTMIALELTLAGDDYANQGGITACHDVTHVAGKAAMAILKNKQQAFQSCTPLCGYGCFMGVIDGYFHSQEQFDREFSSVCSEDAFPLPCFHALGHAIGDRIGAVDRSVAYCGKLKTSDFRQQCVSGLFMERFEASDYGHDLVPIPIDLYKFCSLLPDVDGRIICYRRSGWMAYLRTGDTAAAVRTCDTIPDIEQSACLFTLGQEMYYEYKGEASAILSFCTVLSDRTATEKCLEGALGSSVISEVTARHGVELCTLADGGYRTFCFATLGENILNSPNGEVNRVNVCSPLAAEDAAVCLGQ